ncbi:hypothetical protein ZIOFF_029401 [Zingiber officinale]|uniref:R13L1/DRL21-like LRR repeat region domain-containing protein n=1 Tax=Zingiber officinale TaxID=94328 RepID=A0A8J5GWL6_ZINOF|nr:hypothetical protein ZIOFF_029401 [Zingiber officinale]
MLGMMKTKQSERKIGEEIILKKLDGVPLIAKSIGGALNGKLEPDHWMNISRRYEGGRPAPWMDTQSLSWLESLRLYACTSLEKLPLLWKLLCLKFLRLNHMKAIRSLGHHFSGQVTMQFPVLEELEFSDLPLWEEWNGANDYIWFPHLKSFKIKKCSNLKKIPNLPLSIEKLHMQNLELEALPRSYKCSNGFRTFGGFQMSLKSLQIYNCPGIVQIGSMEEDDNLLPSSLKELILGGILVEHKDLTCYLRDLTSLSNLFLYCSSGMESLPSANELEHLTALQYLSIWDEKLKTLSIQNKTACLSSEIEEWLLQCQESLEDLQLVRMTHLQLLPASLESFSSLKHLSISYALELKSLPRMPASLERLTISGCSAKLKKRCQKNIGLDWPNINRISHINIETDEEDKDEVC